MSATVRAARRRHERLSGVIVRVLDYDQQMTQERHERDVARRGDSRWGTVRAGSWKR